MEPGRLAGAAPRGHDEPPAVGQPRRLRVLPVVADRQDARLGRRDGHDRDAAALSDATRVPSGEMAGSRRRRARAEQPLAIASAAVASRAPARRLASSRTRSRPRRPGAATAGVPRPVRAGGRGDDERHGEEGTASFTVVAVRLSRAAVRPLDPPRRRDLPVGLGPPSLPGVDVGEDVVTERRDRRDGRLSSPFRARACASSSRPPRSASRARKRRPARTPGPSRSTHAARRGSRRCRRARGAAGRG